MFTYSKVHIKLYSITNIKYANIYFQLNRVLGRSYDKKMAVIGLLKQYSVNRDIESLVRSFSELLKTEQERTLLPVLR